MTPPAHALREPQPRTRPAPTRPRRTSGPVAPRVARRPRRAHGRGAAVLDRLLRGRGWVMLIGALLAGIVFLNVSVLELNRGIAATTAKSAKLEAQNSLMRARLADVASPEAIQRAAQALGFVLPQPGDVGYLRIRPGDAAVAAKRLDASQASATTQAVTPSVPQTVTPTVAPPVTPVTPTSALASAPATGTATGTASAGATPAAATAASGGR